MEEKIWWCLKLGFSFRKHKHISIKILWNFRNFHTFCTKIVQKCILNASVLLKWYVVLTIAKVQTGIIRFWFCFYKCVITIWTKSNCDEINEIVFFPILLRTILSEEKRIYEIFDWKVCDHWEMLRFRRPKVTSINICIYNSLRAKVDRKWRNTVTTMRNKECKHNAMKIHHFHRKDKKKCRWNILLLIKFVGLVGILSALTWCWMTLLVFCGCTHLTFH